MTDEESLKEKRAAGVRDPWKVGKRSSSKCSCARAAEVEGGELLFGGSVLCGFQPSTQEVSFMCYLGVDL